MTRLPILLFLAACTGKGGGDDTATTPAPIYCTGADATGRYAFLEEGTVDGTPYIAGGTLTFAADGTFALDAGQSTDGTIGVASPPTGTWTLDGTTCAGTALDASGNAAFDFTLVTANDEIRTIRTSAGTVLTGRAKAAAEGCTDANVAAEYGYGINAIVYLDIEGWPVGPSYFAGSGVVAVDPTTGKVVWSGVETPEMIQAEKAGKKH